MHAIEFEAEIKKDQIRLPEHLHLADGMKVRVLILTGDSEREKTSTLAPNDVWTRSAGAWQGEPLKRETQGDFSESHLFHC